MSALKAIAKLIGVLIALWIGWALLDQMAPTTKWGTILLLGIGYLSYLVEDFAKKQRALVEQRFDRLEDLLRQLDGNLLTPYVTNELEEWVAERKRHRREDATF